MVERTPSDAGYDSLHIYLNGRSPEMLQALGVVASGMGLRVEYGAEAVPQPWPANVAPEEAEADQRPGVANKKDFEQAAVEIGFTEPSGAKAWYALTRDFAAAQQRGGVPLVQFEEYPGAESNALYPELLVSDLSVRSLATLVDKLNRMIYGRSDTAAKAVLKYNMPRSTGLTVLRIWERAVQNALPKDEAGIVE